MNDKEFNILLQKMKNNLKQIKKDPESGRRFLIMAGIITEKGNLRKPYKNLPYLLQLGKEKESKKSKIK